ncbi:MAG: rRNA maturation RNase YbeY [Candidatus Mycalebacterium zealandia]|nr:MAG: rRNA maturation RNase YbeY [Candidatus Mycalebacterium zealandia]
MFTERGARNISISITDRSGLAEKKHLKLITLCARKATALLSPGGDVSIAIIDDNEMRELNKTYRKISKTTDVLSFEQNTGGLAGDVAISIETARRRADLYGITFEEEIKRLVIHGISHLAGHTHKKKKEREKMRAEESRVFRAIAGL